MNRSLVVLLVALPAAAGAQLPVDTAARPITLDEAVRLAEQNSPATVQARGNERASRYAVRSAYAAFVPSVTLTAGGTRAFTGATRTRINNGVTEQLPSQPWSYNNGIGFNVDLFDGGRRFYNIGASKANVQAAAANEVSQQFAVSLNVKQQFFNVLAARESEAAARTQLEEAQQQLKFATARVAAGVATMSDSLRSVIQVGNAQLAVLTAQNQLRVADAALTRLVAAPFLVTAAPSDSVDAITAPLDSATLIGLAARGPAVQQSEANLTAARAQRRAARAPYLPTLTMSYSRGGSGVDPYFGFGSGSYVCSSSPLRDSTGAIVGSTPTYCDAFSYTGSLRFNISYPVFNQLTREESVVRAEVAEDIAQANLRDARLAAQQNLTQYIASLENAQQRIVVQRASVAAAIEDLRVQQQRYSLGASTLLDVLTSQTQLNQAQAALIQARYDYRVTRAQIEALIGRSL